MQIWDVMTYLVVVVLSLLVFAAYDDRATTGSLQQLCGSFLLLLLYGAAVIPLGYAYSFGFTSPSTAQVFFFGFTSRSAAFALFRKLASDISGCAGGNNFFWLCFQRLDACY